MNPTWRITRRALPGALAGTWAAARAQLPAEGLPADSARWQVVRRHLFADRTIIDAPESELLLKAPRRADDPAFVPMLVRAAGAAASGAQRLWLVIDNNPSPVTVALTLPPDGALPEFETRVRVDEYTWVRAIVETADGRLRMATRYVKASGGCSAAAGSDEAAALAALGRMSFQSAAPAVDGQPMGVQWMVSHPNHSGMAMNQSTRQYTPAYFVRQVRLLQGERLLLEADVDFGLSENPSLRFRFVPRGPAPLRAEVLDTRDRRFEASVPLAELARAGG